MSEAVLLLVLRYLGALVLLGFLAAAFWIIVQDMQMTAAALSEKQQEQGFLRVLVGDAAALAPDTLFPLAPVTSMGRSNGNTIVIDDGYASAEHALITLRGEQWWLEDLGSRNGTLLNNLPVNEPVVLSTGDLITVGDTQLKFEA